MNFTDIKDSTIFAVDDNKQNLKLLVQYLSDIKLNVIPLRSGEQLLGLITKRIPDMILLDIMMPGGLDGYETCRRLKANEATKDIPVIFMSALAETFDKVNGFNLGAVDYITKPIEIEELQSRIHTHLSISQLQKQLLQINTKLEEKVLARTEELRKSNLQLQERATRLELLAETSQKTIGILSLSELLNQTVIMIRDTFKFHDADIFLVEDKHLVLRATAREADNQYIGKEVLSIGLEGICGWVAKHGEALHVPDVSKDKRYFKELSKIKTKSEIAVPIKVKGKIYGVLDVISLELGILKEIDVFTLQTISDQLAIAIENANLYENAQAEIIERKKINNELVKAKNKAEESDRLKTAFLSTMSHELRTPLNAIIGFSSLIDDDMTIKETLKYSNLINKSGVHLLGLIEEIMNVSMLESKDITVKTETFAIDQLMADLNLRISEELKAKKKPNIEVNQIIEENLKRIKLSTDQSKLSRVLLILVKNAVKFTNEGFIEYGYKIHNRNQVIFYIKDSGIGIPKNKQSIIFDKFRMADDTDSRSHGGLGVGLFIARRLVEAIGGKLWVESKVDKGSTFFFTIPYNSTTH